MNYIELLKHIKNYAMNIKMVNSTFDGDVYTNWNTESVSYGSVNVGLESIDRSDNTVTYNVVLYYGDRLLQDKSNVNEIWIDGINTLQSIINSLPDDISYETPITFTPFEQKFADYLAGQYVRIGLETEFDLGNCSIDVMEQEKKYITINKNGEYNVSNYDVATVNVQSNVEEIEKTVYCGVNGTFTLSPDAGYDGFSKATIHLNTDSEERTINITENGTTVILPRTDAGSGWKALTKITINVNVPNT